MIQAAFLEQLVEAIANLSPSDRAALTASETVIEIVTASEPEDVEMAGIEKAVKNALGGTPGIRFVTDPDMIAGLELRQAHFVLRNSWRADLETIRKEVANVD